MTRDDLEIFLTQSYADRGGAIGVCGLPGSGKSTLVRKLSSLSPNRALSINLDDFCIAPTLLRKGYLKSALDTGDLSELRRLARPEKQEDNPYANPLTWYDWKAAADALDRLKAGETVVRHNAWNQATGLCDKQEIYVPPQSPNAIYFIDCVYLFEAVLRSRLDSIIMIDMPPERSFAREVERDSHRNEDVYFAYKKIVTDLYCMPYLEQHRGEMDFVISGG